MAEKSTFLTGDGVKKILQAIADKFVKKEAGKGLSTNDFTSAYKDKLDALKETVSWDNIGNKPETFEPSKHTHNTSDITGLDEILSQASKDAVQYTEQELTNDQQTQARKNIGAAGNWNELKDRPFYEKDDSLKFDSMSFDGNVESLSPAATTTVDTDSGDTQMNVSYYKVSDKILTTEQLDGSTIQAFGGEGFDDVIIDRYSTDSPLRVCSDNGSVQYGSFLVSIAKENDTVTLGGFEKDVTLTFAETGTYFLYATVNMDDVGEMKFYTSTLNYGRTVYLDSRFIDPYFSGLVYNALQQSQKGAPDGVASLDSSGRVPSDQLPSYVDDAIEGYLFENNFYEEKAHENVINAEGGKIYIDLATNDCYRWGGSVYVKIADPGIRPMTDGEIDEILALWE